MNLNSSSVDSSAASKLPVGLREAIESRPLPEDYLNELREDARFNYEVDTAQYPQPWDWLTEFIAGLFEKLFQVTPSTETVENFIIGAAIVLVLYATYRLFRAEKNRFFVKSNEAPQSAKVLGEEDLKHIDLNAEIARAREAENWRLLIRLEYLRTLKMLAQKRYLKLDTGKTNYDYYYEIGNSEILHLFKQLSHVFEYTWYGNYRADREMAERCSDYIAQMQNFTRS